MSQPTASRATVALLSILGCLTIALVTSTTAGGETIRADDLTPYRNIPLWESGKVPLATGSGPLDTPFLTTFLPPEGKRNGASVIIAPGGANIMLMYGGEGLEIAERYNDWGVTAFVLTYRLSPRYGENARVLDGKRAIQDGPRPRGRRGSSIPPGSASSGSPPDRTWAARGRGRACRRSERRGPGGSRQLASGLPGACLWRRAGRRRANRSRLSADVPAVGARRHRPVARLNAQLFMDLTRAGAVAEVHVYQKGRHGFGSGFGSPAFLRLDAGLEHFLTAGRIPPGGDTEHGTAGRFPFRRWRRLRWSLRPRHSRPQSCNDGYGDYVYVPAGSFKMGDNFGDGESRERPVHVVELDAFYIGKFEMTNGEWKKFRDDPGYDDPEVLARRAGRAEGPGALLDEANNHGGGTPDSDNYPVLGVNWDSAIAYCNWLSAKTGKKYRLPTEAEWEKAARGTDQRRYPWGNTIDHSYANLRRRAAVSTPDGPSASTTAASAATCKRTATLRRTARSTWPATSWSGARTGTAATTTPSSPRKNPKGPASGAYRVVRGGIVLRGSRSTCGRTHDRPRGRRFRGTA